MTDDETLDLAARDTADDLWTKGPLTQVEEDGWRDDLPEADNMAVLRMRRFCAVRGAPKQPAAHPEIWRAMLQHDDWRAWLGLIPVEPFSGALGCGMQDLGNAMASALAAALAVGALEDHPEESERCAAALHAWSTATGAFR